LLHAVQEEGKKRDMVRGFPTALHNSMASMWGEEGGEHTRPYGEKRPSLGKGILRKKRVKGNRQLRQYYKKKNFSRSRREMADGRGGELSSSKPVKLGTIPRFRQTGFAKTKPKRKHLFLESLRKKTYIRAALRKKGGVCLVTRSRGSLTRLQPAPRRAGQA